MTPVDLLNLIEPLSGGFCGPTEALDALSDAHPLVSVGVIAAVIATVMLGVAQRWRAFSVLASLLVVGALIASWNIGSN